MERNWIKSGILDDILDARAYQMKFIENIVKLKKSSLTLKKLNLLCDGIYRGNTPAHIEGEIADGALLLKTVNIRSNELDLGKVFSMEASIYEQEKRFQLFENDICITIMGATEDIVGRSWVYNKNIGKACFSDGIAKINNANIDPYYLSIYINSYYGHLSVIQFSGSSTRSYVTNTQLGETLIPIPSPEIQKYIGDKVRKAEELIEEGKKLNLLCENEIKKVLNLCEGECLYNNNAGKKSLEYNDYPIKIYVDPRNIDNRLDPKSYHPELYKTLKKIEKLNCKHVKLKELLDRFSTGKSSPNYVDDGLPILMTKNIKNNAIDWDCKAVDKNSVNQFEMIDKEEILITTYGGPSIGKVDILFEEISCTFDYTILKIKFNENFNPYFMTLLLRSKFIQNQIRYIIKGTTGITFVIPNEILDIRIPVINKEIQDEIGEVYKKYLDNIKKSKILIEQAKQEIEDLIEGNFDMSKIKENN